MKQENLVVAVIGEDRDASEILLKGFKKFSPDKIILLHKKGNDRNLRIVEKDLKRLSIPYIINSVSNFLQLEELFIKIKEIQLLNSNSNIIINVDTDYMSSCLALSSAFVNGIAAIGILEEKIIAYPIMKFSYYNTISEKKKFILETINEEKEVFSMEKLSKLTKMSLPLIAYHLKGNRDSKGLIEMKLVHVERINGSLNLKLSELGRLIISGYIDFECPDCKKT
jgi:hypothetical protein